LERRSYLEAAMLLSAGHSHVLYRAIGMASMQPDRGNGLQPALSAGNCGRGRRVVPCRNGKDFLASADSKHANVKSSGHALARVGDLLERKLRHRLFPAAQRTD
jgi:hypothetical protein